MNKKDMLIEFLKRNEGKSFEGTLESSNENSFQFISYIQNAKVRVTNTGIVILDQKERYYFNIPFHEIKNVINESDDNRSACNVFYENGYNILVEINNEY